MEGGAGWRSVVLWKHQAIKSLALTLKLLESIHLILTQSSLLKNIISHSLTFCLIRLRMKRLDPNLYLFLFVSFLIYFMFDNIWYINLQVILVGHSAGGLSLTDALHKFGSKKIQLAIYVSANMLKYGINIDEDVTDVRFNFLLN